VAVTRVTAGDHHPVGASLEGAQDEAGLDPPGAHHANHPEMRPMLKA
jgi:hypothetical protein